jgi:hypothetical protein
LREKKEGEKKKDKKIELIRVGAFKGGGQSLTDLSSCQRTNNNNNKKNFQTQM